MPCIEFKPIKRREFMREKIKGTGWAPKATRITLVFENNKGSHRYKSFILTNELYKTCEDLKKFLHSKIYPETERQEKEGYKLVERMMERI